MNTTGQVMPNGDTVYYEDSKAREMFADAYDSTKSYAVGNHCIKDDVLYVCNTAIPSGGETWNLAHWTATTYDAEVSQLKSNLTNNTYVTTGITTHADATLQYGGYVIVGKIVIVNMRVDITNSIGAYNEIVKGLPYPVSFASNYIAITNSKGLGMYLSTGGSIQNSVSIPSGAIQISGVYLSI